MAEYDIESITFGGNTYNLSKFLTRNYHVDLKNATWSKEGGIYYADCSDQTGVTVTSDFSQVFSIIPYWFSIGNPTGTDVQFLQPLLKNTGSSSNKTPLPGIRFMSTLDISANYSSFQLKVSVFGIAADHSI